MTAAPSKERRPRFRRGASPPLHLTTDDIAILRYVAEHRFLSSRHLVQLLPHRSSKKLTGRLSALYHAAYLDRPRAQLIYYATAGSAPLVYGLGNKGAELLAHDFPSVAAKVDWTWKNRSVRQLFIAHTLITADVMVAIITDTQRDPEFRLISSDDIAQGRRDAFALKSKPAEFDREATVVPDAVFGLERSGIQKFFFLESDRATMPIVRSDPEQTSVARKFRIYLAGGGSPNRFGMHLGISNFRVLTVTSSKDRMAKMIHALREMTGGSGSRQFLFADADSLRAERHVLSYRWLSGKGDRLRLFD